MFGKSLFFSRYNDALQIIKNTYSNTFFENRLKFIKNYKIIIRIQNEE